jgi:hypothetical protein
VFALGVTVLAPAAGAGFAQVSAAQIVQEIIHFQNLLVVPKGGQRVTCLFPVISPMGAADWIIECRLTGLGPLKGQRYLERRLRTCSGNQAEPIDA